jgi:hypothetical protein
MILGARNPTPVRRNDTVTTSKDEALREELFALYDALNDAHELMIQAQRNAEDEPSSEANSRDLQALRTWLDARSALHIRINMIGR